MILPPQTMHYYKGEFPQKNHTYKTLAACFIPPKSGSHLITPVSVSSILPSSTELRMRNDIWFNFSFAALAFGDVGSLPNRRPNWTPETSLNKKYHSHRIHVWYIYLHLPYKSTKCRQIYHTWMVWDCDHPGLCL